MEKYKKEGKCFKCGKIGHKYKMCLLRKAQKETPKVSFISFESKDSNVHALFHKWGKIQNQNAFILMDPSSTNNVISFELAQKLGTKTKEIGNNDE